MLLSDWSGAKRSLFSLIRRASYGCLTQQHASATRDIRPRRRRVPLGRIGENRSQQRRLVASHPPAGREM